MTAKEIVARMPAEDDMIKWLRIQNFRSLVDVTVDLDPLTVLIGRSGTGKSNFVQSIRFLRDCLTARQVNVNTIGGPQRALHIDHQRDPLAFHLRFSIAGVDDGFEYGIHGNPATGQVVAEYLKLGGTLLFEHANGKWTHTPGVVPTPQPQAIMLGAIPVLQESAFAYVALRTGIGCYDFPGDVLAGPGGGNSDQGLMDTGSNYLSVAERIHSDLSKAHSWKQITKSLRAVNRAASRLTLNAPNADRLDIGYQLNGRLLTFDVRQESEGLRRYLAQMLALYQNPSKQTLVFEHPEAGLHPGALESLAHEFKACPQDGRGQVILTTHSPQLLDYFPPESLRVVDVDKMETKIGRVAPEQMESLRERLLQPGELLTVDPARLPGQLAEVPE
jgi:predicted ATPase